MQLDREKVIEICDTFNENHSFDQPYLIEDGDGVPIRVLNASVLMGRNPKLNVAYVPFGGSGHGECPVIPNEIDGLKVRFLSRGDTPLAADEVAKRHFAHTYMRGKVGRIEGGDGALVTLNAIGLPRHGSREEFGVPEGETAFCVRHIPADEEEVLEEILVFPKTFEGLNVYYRKGFTVQALSKE